MHSTGRPATDHVADGPPVGGGGNKRQRPEDIARFDQAIHQPNLDRSPIGIVRPTKRLGMDSPNSITVVRPVPIGISIADTS